MSRYQAYPEYKDSGVEWVGAIPNSWEVSPLFSLASTDVLKNDDGAENNVLSLSYGRIIRRDVEDNHGLLPESFNTYQLVAAGDIILRLTDLQNDKRSLRVGLACEKGIITSAYLKLTAKQKFLDRYLYRLLHSYDTTKVFYGMGGGLRQSMKFEEMRRLQMLCPSLDEQKQIAAFLDHETAKIDALIEKQQRLIELLKEKRQAVISQAVTKGLNPNAPMKDSGVEWQGEVPAHWDVLKLGYLMKLKGGAGFPDSYQSQEGHEIPFYKVGDLARANSESCLTEPLHTVTYETAKELRATIFNTGSIVFAKVGAALLLKRFCTLNKPSCIDNNMMGAEIRSIDLREFLLFVMPLLEFELIVNPGAVPSVNGEQITSILIALPPQDEQIEIVDFLKTSRLKFDHLIRNAEQAISLFQERRTALIAAAVTGKIDVRDWQAAA